MELIKHFYGSFLWIHMNQISRCKPLRSHSSVLQNSTERCCQRKHFEDALVSLAIFSLEPLSKQPPSSASRMRETFRYLLCQLTTVKEGKWAWVCLYHEHQNKQYLPHKVLSLTLSSTQCKDSQTLLTLLQKKRQENKCHIPMTRNKNES